MLHHNDSRPNGDATAVVIDLFAKKRDRLSKKFGAGHPTLRPREARLATVTPIGTRRRSAGD